MDEYKKKEWFGAVKSIAWLNIVVQCVFPMVVAFTPTTIIAGNKKNTYSSKHTLSLNTKTYTLKRNESAQSVAHQYNLTLDELRKLNQLRIFAEGFDNIKEGDELDVPLELLQASEWHIDDVPDQQMSAQNMANAAMRAGQFLSSHPDSEAASSMARGLAVGRINDEVEQWLGNFGTARIRLALDDRFSLKASQAELLTPWVEYNNNMLFTQFGLHRTDNRTQGNIGWGVRYSGNDFMVGGNSFIDHDFSQRHSRLGIGAEYWRDYFKLSVNSYLSLSAWKDAPELEDYVARPASGWDIRTEAWIPDLPQLGGKFIWEKYYGNEVALFGQDQRQKNPYAVSLEINYTPIPLLTFDVAQRQGKSNYNDSRIGVQLNYMIGTPWRQQIDRAAVSGMRSLARSIYSLVERNNNIILDYKKSDVIKIWMSPLIVGFFGEIKPLNVSVNGKYEFERIDWIAAELMAAGGSILAKGDIEHVVVLPAYQYGDNARNSYDIQAIAVDKKGNRSKPFYTQVTVNQDVIDIKKSQFTPVDVTMPAGDKSTPHIMTLAVNNTRGQIVDLREDEISLKREQISPRAEGATVGKFQRIAPGRYSLGIVAGSSPEQFTLTPSARGATFTAATVNIVANSATTDITLNKSVVNSDVVGKGAYSIEASVEDGNGKPVVGTTVNFQATGIGADKVKIYGNGITDQNGKASVSVTSTKAGIFTILASMAGNKEKKVDVSFEPDRNSARFKNDNFSVTPEENTLADGMMEKKISVALVDKYHNPITDKDVNVSVDNSGLVVKPVIRTDKYGKGSTAITSKSAGVFNVKVAANGQELSKKVSFIANLKSARVTDLVSSVSEAVVSNKPNVSAIALVLDGNGNVLADTDVEWIIDLDNTKVVIQPENNGKTNREGIAKLNFSSTVAGVAQVTAQVKGNTDTALAKMVKVVFKPYSSVTGISELSITPKELKADGQANAVLKAKVVDGYGNPVPGVEVTLSADPRVHIENVTLLTNNVGEISTRVNSKEAGKYTITLSSKSFAIKQSVSVTFLPDSASAIITDIIPSSTQAVVSDTSSITVMALVLDANNNVLPDIDVEWGSVQSSPRLTVEAVNKGKTNKNGVSKAVVKSTLSGEQIITASIKGMSGTKNAKILFSPDVDSAQIQNFSVQPEAETLADGIAQKTISLVVNDRYGNPLPETSVSVTADNSAKVKDARLITGKEGKATTTLSSQKAGDSTVTITLSGQPVLQKTVRFLADKHSATVQYVTSDAALDGVVADGKTEVNLEALVVDAMGNPLPDMSVAWKSEKDPTLIIVTPKGRTDKHGIAKAVVVGKMVTEAEISASVNNSQQKIKIKFKADMNGGQVTLTHSSPTFVVGKSVTITAKVQDQNNLPVANAIINWNIIKGNHQKIHLYVLDKKTDANGEARVLVTTTVAEDIILQATLTSNRNEDTIQVTAIPDPLAGGGTI